MNPPPAPPAKRVSHLPPRPVRAPGYFRRLRQLFMLFLFAVFLFWLSQYQEREEELLTPPIAVGIFQFVPPGETWRPIVKTLNDPDEAQSLHAVQGWFEEEYRRYTGFSDPLLQVTISDPWIIRLDIPPLPQPGDLWWTIAWRSWRYSSYFHKMTRLFGERPERYGARLYLSYQSGDDVTSHSRGSRKGRLAVATIALDEANPAYALTAVAHELAHVLGAQDSYDPQTYLATWPHGFAQPNADPLFPQRYAELMAGDIPLSNQREQEVQRLDQVRIGHQTAADMGWITQEEAARYYGEK